MATGVNESELDDAFSKTMMNTFEKPQSSGLIDLKVAEQIKANVNVLPGLRN